MTKIPLILMTGPKPAIGHYLPKWTDDLLMYCNCSVSEKDYFEYVCKEIPHTFPPPPPKKRGQMGDQEPQVCVMSP